MNTTLKRGDRTYDEDEGAPDVATPIDDFFDFFSVAYLFSSIRMNFICCSSSVEQRTRMRGGDGKTYSTLEIT